MPASIHPPVQLRIVLDEDSYERGDGVEMARRFTAVAPTEVVRASKGSQRANVLRFDVGSDAVVAEAQVDPLWRDALTAWLDEEFDEASALVARENDARRNNGERQVLFSWAEVKFGSGPVIAIRMRESAIPPEAAGFVARARELLDDGAFGADSIAAIRIPACASIEAQRDDARSGDGGEAGLESREPDGGGWRAADPDAQNAWAADAVKADAPTRAELDDALAEAEAALRHGGDPADAAIEELDAVGEGEPPRSVRASVAESRREVDTSGEGCAILDQDVPESLDYRIWNVAYADGTSVRFDSVLGEALLD